MSVSEYESVAIMSFTARDTQFGAIRRLTETYQISVLEKPKGTVCHRIVSKMQHNQQFTPACKRSYLPPVITDMMLFPDSFVAKITPYIKSVANKEYLNLYHMSVLAMKML